MPTRAGQVVIDITAGTSKFVVDMESAKAKIREFGATGVSEHKAVAAAMKTLEGNFLSNRRAADAFLTMIPGIGTALKVAFPVVGAIAFAGVLVETGTKVNEFFKNLREAPEKAAASWHTLNQSVRTAADDLDVANARLENDIAKLEGKRQNNLALALAEAKAAADKLGESIDKDVASVNKLMSEQSRSFLQSLFLGSDLGGDALRQVLGGESGVGGLAARLQKISDDEAAALERLKTAGPAQPDQYGIRVVNEAVSPDQMAANISHTANMRRMHEFETLSRGIGNALQSEIVAPEDRERLEYVRMYLDEEMRRIRASELNTNLTARDQRLKTGRENEDLEKPFKDRIASLDAELSGIQAKLGAIGAPESVQIMAKAFAEAQKIIAEVNKELERHGIKLSDAQKKQIEQKELTIASTDAQVSFGAKLQATTTAIDDRIRSQRALAESIGQGYEAVKQFNVEARILSTPEIGPHVNDTEWMGGHAGEIETLRSKYGAEYDAQHQAQVAESIQMLNDQIGLEQDLAAVEAQGAEAVRQVELAHRLATIARDNDAESGRKLIGAEIELYNLERTRASADEVSKIDQKIEATERLTAAVLKGADAVRHANIENRIAEIMRDEGGPTIGAANRIEAATREDQAQHGYEVAQAAAHVNRLQQLDDEIEKLEEAKQIYGDSLSIDIAIRDLENQKLHAIAEQTLALGGVRNGLKAFFEEMRADAANASRDIAKSIYDALNGTVDGISTQLARLATGQYKKGDFGKMFEGVGEQAIKSNIDTGMHVGLGALGKALPGLSGITGAFDKAVNNKPATLRAGDPGHVIVDNLPGFAGPLAGSGRGDGGIFGEGDEGHGIFSFLNKGDEGGGGFSGFLSGLFGGFRAEGGDVDPGHIYAVGEKEMEFFTPRTAGMVTPLSKLGGDVHLHIDARGAEIGVENRIRQTMNTVHTSAVTQSLRAQADRARRVPQRS